MNINDLKDGFGRDPYLYNDSLYFERDNPYFVREKTISEKELNEKLLKIRRQEIKKLTEL